ncbi:hypothetical protein SLA2020_180430 [Shorea laevis]
MIASVSSKCLNSISRLCPIQFLHPFLTIPNSHFYSQTPLTESNPTSFDHETVRQTFSSYCNDWNRALEFFNWVETECQFKHSNESFNRMIDILGRFFEFDITWDLIQRMRNDPVSMPNHTTFRIMFKRYITAHLVKDAISAFHKSEEFNLKDETLFCNLVDALCEYKHVIEAQDLCFGKNGKLGFNVDDTKICNMILRGWFKMGWWRKCREFWEEMDKRSVKKCLYSYSIYMDIMCKSEKPWKAVKLYKEMKRKGIKLDTVAYNIVIRAISLSEGVDFGIGVFREMRELGLEPSVATYNTILKLLCEYGRVRDAYSCLIKCLRRVMSQMC